MSDTKGSMYLATSTFSPDTVLLGFARQSRPGSQHEIRIRSELLDPVVIGDFSYSLLESLEALAGRSAVFFPDGRSSAFTVAATIWACCELDLTRFARDPLIRHACWAASQAEASEADGSARVRFARLNDLMRSLVRGIAPWGMVPREFASLAGGQAILPSGSIRSALNRFLVPLSVNPERLINGLCAIFAEY